MFLFTIYLRIRAALWRWSSIWCFFLRAEDNCSSGCLEYLFSRFTV